MTMLWAGFLLGLAGSAHCALMCGPFAALVAPRGGRAVIHHGSRIVAYAILGASTGFLGSAFVGAGAGRLLTTAAALTLLAQAFIKWPASSAFASTTSRLLGSLMGTLHRIRERHRLLAAVGAGVVNGLLPCGLVYSALVASLGLGGPLQGAVFMTAFGAATVPALGFATGIARSAATRVPVLSRLAPIVLIVVAVLIAFRGWSAWPLPMHSH